MSHEVVVLMALRNAERLTATGVSPESACVQAADAHDVDPIELFMLFGEKISACQRARAVLADTDGQLP